MSAGMEAFRALYSSLPQEMVDVLNFHGLKDTFQIYAVVGVDETCAQVWYELVSEFKNYDQQHLIHHLHLFARLVEEARRAQPRRTRLLATTPLSELEAEFAVKRQRRDREELERRFLGGGVRHGSIVRGTLPPRLTTTARRRHSLGPVSARAVAGGLAEQEEAALRKGLVDQLVDLLLHVGGPMVEQARLASDPRAMLALTAGGRRARTLRTRLRAWKAFASWLEAAHHESWPSTWARLLDYAQVRADEPCGRQSLLGFFGAVKFIEVAAGYPPEAQMTQHVLYSAAVKEILARVSARAGGQGARSAHRPLVSQLRWYEGNVMNEGATSWLRVYSFWKLLQAWASLRFDDHRGLSPSSLRREDGGLVGELSRTKTSGADKKIESRPIAISAEAYIEHPRWAATGLDILHRITPPDRDYLLSSPCKDFEGVQSRPLTYAAAAGWSRALIFQLMDELDSGAVAALVGKHYTEHSMRAWLPSAAQAVGAPESHLEVLGGWKAQSSRAYMRSVRPKMRLIQAETARILRANLGGKDVFDERSLIAALGADVGAQGYDLEQVNKLLQPLVSYPIPADDAMYWSVDVGAAGEVGPAAMAASSMAASSTSATCSQTLPAAASGEIPRSVGAAVSSDVRPRVPAEVKGFVVSISGKHSFRRLHQIGRCHRVPGVDYARFEELGEVLPPASEYDDVCGQCWRRGQEVGATAPPPASSKSATDKPRGQVGRPGSAEVDRPSSSGESECSADDSSSTDLVPNED